MKILSVKVCVKALVPSIVIALLSACQSTAPIVDSSSERARTSKQSSSTANANAPVSAVTAVLQQAQGFQAQGQWDKAIELAERGLRIDRRMPELYLVLAQSYDRMGQIDSSISFARQGLRYTAVGSILYKELLSLLP